MPHPTQTQTACRWCGVAIPRPRHDQRFTRCTNHRRLRLHFRLARCYAARSSGSTTGVANGFSGDIWSRHPDKHAHRVGAPSVRGEISGSDTMEIAPPASVWSGAFAPDALGAGARLAGSHVEGGGPFAKPEFAPLGAARHS